VAVGTQPAIGSGVEGPVTILTGVATIKVKLPGSATLWCIFRQVKHEIILAVDGSGHSTKNSVGILHLP